MIINTLLAPVDDYTVKTSVNYTPQIISMSIVDFDIYILQRGKV